MLPNCILTQAEFSSLCYSFNSITKLDINASSLKSLTGISNLRNLELLSFVDLKIQTKEYMVDLFELEKLRILSIGGLVR